MSEPKWYEDNQYSELNDLLALSHVPRWAIVAHSKPQSVADHTFRVMVIALSLSRLLNIDLSRSAILDILYHDADESRSGDVPAPFKDRYPLPRAWETCPWLNEHARRDDVSAEQRTIIVLADLIEAYTFIHRWGVGAHSVDVALGVKVKIDLACPESWTGEVGRLVKAILTDEGR